MEGEGGGDVGAALAGNPALVEGGDVLAEAALLADLLQEVARAQQALRHVCATHPATQSVVLPLATHSECPSESEQHLWLSPGRRRPPCARQTCGTRPRPPSSPACRSPEPLSAIHSHRCHALPCPVACWTRPHRCRLPAAQLGGVQGLGAVHAAPGVRLAARVQRRRLARVQQVDRLPLLEPPASPSHAGFSTC